MVPSSNSVGGSEEEKGREEHTFGYHTNDSREEERVGQQEKRRVGGERERRD